MFQDYRKTRELIRLRNGKPRTRWHLSRVQKTAAGVRKSPPWTSWSLRGYGRVDARVRGTDEEDTGGQKDERGFQSMHDL